MDGGSVSIALANKLNFLTSETPRRKSLAAGGASRSAKCSCQRPFLRIPPFPGARVRAFTPTDRGDVGPDLINLIRQMKVGGPYWAAQPELPARYLLVTDVAALSAADREGDPVVLWTHGADATVQAADFAINGECDPWHMLAGATKLVTSAADELAVIGLILGVPVELLDARCGSLTQLTDDPRDILLDVLSAGYENPFTGTRMSVTETAELCGFWRTLVDSNRDVAGAIGFAFWKQRHVAPLLWGGTHAVQFVRSGRSTASGRPVAIWRSKITAEQVRLLEKQDSPLIEVEDGFLRSQGLGADCVPPLSIVVDRLGAHFDPSRPSELELILQNHDFEEGALARAGRLRHAIVEARLGKYERARVGFVRRRTPGRRHILVPGQVEDDRAVQSGGCGLTSNLDLLARVKAREPDAYLLYKPHPDVLAGHRPGAIADKECLAQADEIVRDQPISSLIEMVDEVHVNTSLAGFEALLRDKPVTTYGVPFYSGWGLTRDLGPVPARRTRRRTLEELIAATMLIYPRYLDPVTGLPCPAEVLVDRLSMDEQRRLNPIVFMRRLQGRLLRRFRGLAA